MNYSHRQMAEESNQSKMLFTKQHLMDHYSLMVEPIFHSFDENNTRDQNMFNEKYFNGTLRIVRKTF
jgi:hypothetical protein